VQDEVLVPFAFRGRRTGAPILDLSVAGIERLAELFGQGLKSSSVQQQAYFLKRHRPPRRTRRGVVRLRLPHGLFKEWQERKSQIQKISNRRIADRLPVAALALALSPDDATIPSSSVDRGFLSLTELRDAASSENDAHVANQATPASNESRVQYLKPPLPENPRRHPIMVTATALSFEEAARVFDLTAVPDRSTHTGTPEEISQSFAKLQDKLDRHIRDLKP
jgi:hypothetical protein